MTLRTERSYRGRFAPSPTGPLHLGSLVAALGSWLDARACGGTWLLRIEDIDPPREMPGAAAAMITTLAACGLHSDETVLWQRDRSAAYQAALSQLITAQRAYGCACSRKEAEDAASAAGLRPGVYAGTCRAGTAGRPPRSVRLRVPDPPVDMVSFVDRAAGSVTQHLAHEVGDFVLRRADGLWAYQLAVVVDDAAQGITDVVRGADLLDNTPRQIWLQNALRLPTPRYLHLPVVVNAQGEKLSKQTGAQAIDAADPLRELERAWQQLGFAPLGADSISAFLRRATQLWAQRWHA